MALSAGQQLKYWGIATAVFVALLWLLGDVLLPFVLGGAIAYFLDPVADRLERAGLSRAAATALITIATLLVFVIGALLVIPALVNQTVQLVDQLPAMAGKLRDFVQTRFPSAFVENTTL